MKNYEEPAFPIIIDDISTKQYTYCGLSKLEYMATSIMQGLCVPCIAGSHNLNDMREAKMKAEMAVRLARAILTEINAEKESEK